VPQLPHSNSSYPAGDNLWEYFSSKSLEIFLGEEIEKLFVRFLDLMVDPKSIVIKR